jgi:hypothetical protein
VQYRFETWIGADQEIANRLRAYLIARAGKEDGPPPTLVVRAWLNPDGTVERVSFDGLKNAGADADLRSILKRGNVGAAVGDVAAAHPVLLAQPEEITQRRERRQARRSAKYFTQIDVKRGCISGGCGEGLFERVYRESRTADEKTKELIAASLSYPDVKSERKNPIVLGFMLVIPGG